MDINLLALDVGHGRVKLGVFEAGELVYTNHAAADGPFENVTGAIEEAWRRLADRGAEVAMSASNHGLAPAIEKAVVVTGAPAPQVVGRGIDLPIKVGTDEPEQTGVDRVLNVAAAYEQLKKACVVVDAGSAVTVDFCDDDGTFLGGCIAPGARLQAEALHRLAPQLPLVKPSPTDDAFGRDTTSAVNAGIVRGIRGLVRDAVEAHALTLDTWPEVIATGGDARVLFDGWELVHAISPDLTLYGIALAYTNHHIKHRS
jgi:type III pantothenate kinase